MRDLNLRELPWWVTSLIVALVMGAGYLALDKYVFNSAPIAKQVVAPAQVIIPPVPTKVLATPVITAASPANAPVTPGNKDIPYIPELRVGVLTADRAEVTKDVTTKNFVIKKKTTSPKLVIKEQIEAPKVVADKLETKLFVADKTETPLFEIERSHTKLSDVDREHVIKSDVDEQHVVYQHVDKSEVDYMHVKKADVDEMKVKEMAKASSAAKPVASLKCKDGKCWDPKPQGKYFNIGKLGDAIVKGNTGHPDYDKPNLVSVKIECYSKSWKDLVVVRNATISWDKLLTPEFRRVIEDHRAKMESLKSKQICDKDGRSCLEKTWQINPETGTWSVFKNKDNL